MHILFRTSDQMNVVAELVRTAALNDMILDDVVTVHVATAIPDACRNVPQM